MRQVETGGLTVRTRDVYEVFMRTNIDIDDDLIDEVRRLTGLATKKDIVASALRYYVSALKEDDFEPTRKLGDEMRAAHRERVLTMAPSERAAEALARGRMLLEQAAEAAGITPAEMRERQDAAKGAARRRRRT